MGCCNTALAHAHVATGQAQAAPIRDAAWQRMQPMLHSHTLLLLLLPLTKATQTPAHLNGDPPVRLLRLTGVFNTP